MKHMVIPDTQVKPGCPVDHLKWAGQYAVDKKPETTGICPVSAIMIKGLRALKAGDTLRILQQALQEWKRF